MAAAALHARYTIEEYLRLEEESDTKHEFLDGRIRAMAGGTPEHAAMAARVIAALSIQLRGRRCTVYSSDLRIRVVATGLDTYPDVSVICGEPVRDTGDRNAAVNPIVLVEITSPNNETYDRGEKLEHYRQIPALREIVLVSHREPRVDVWRRDGDDWRAHAAGPGELAQLASIDCVLDVNELYADPVAAP